MGWPTPGAHRRLALAARTGGRKPQDCGRERVCNMPPLAATCRIRWGAGGSFIEAAGWMGQGRFCPLLGLRPKGGAARHSCSIVLNMAAPHTWERFGCQTIDSILLPDTRQGKIRFRKRNAFRNAGRRLACEDFFRLATCRRQATYFFERERSAPECLRHSRGKKFLAGYKGKPAFRGVPRNRNFSRKSRFFCLRGRG